MASDLRETDIQKDQKESESQKGLELSAYGSFPSESGVPTETASWFENPFLKKRKETQISLITPIQIQVYSSSEFSKNPSAKGDGQDNRDSNLNSEGEGSDVDASIVVTKTPNQSADNEERQHIFAVSERSVENLVPEREAQMNLYVEGPQFVGGSDEAAETVLCQPSSKQSSRNEPTTSLQSVVTINSVNNTRFGTIFRQTKASQLLKCFFLFLYYVGMSPYKPQSAKELPKCVQYFYMLVFWTMSIISILQGLDYVKYYWIQFLVEENLLNFLSVGFRAADTFTRICHIRLLVFSVASISSLLNSMDKHDHANNHNTGSGTKAFLAFALGVLSISIAGISTIFGSTQLQMWSWEQARLDRSVEFSETIYVWTSENYTETSERLDDLYGSNLTMQTELFALAGNTLQFCGILHSCLILDLWLIVSVQLYSLQTQLSLGMMRTKYSGSSIGRCPLSIHWKQYTQLRTCSGQSDDIFGSLFKLIHMQNSLSLGYFFFTILKKSSLNADLLVYMFSFAKISATYYLLKKSSRLNEKFEECVVKCSNCGTTCEMDGTVMNVGVLQNDMKMNPIGVGRGEFYVNEAFLLKFIATVGSMFLLLSDKSDD